MSISVLSRPDTQAPNIQFVDYNQLYAQIQAEAFNSNGFTLRQDFNAELQLVLRREAILWQLLQKVPAEAPTVKSITEGNLPTVGFVNRSNLSAAQNPVPAGLNNPPGSVNNDLSDPGQAVKAVSGSVDFGHFERSMDDQQGRLYGNQVAQQTGKLMIGMVRLLEDKLYNGDASIGGGLEFNGLLRQMFPGNAYTLDITTDPAPSIVDKLNEMAARAALDLNRYGRVTAFFCSGGALNKITQEVKISSFNANQAEPVPGYNVPAIMTTFGLCPLIASPYIRDTIGGGGTPDTLNIWALDLDTIEWRGVYPFGGEQTFEPQIFDISQYLGPTVSPLIERRMVLLYGTPYALNNGRGIMNLRITAPAGSAFG